MSRARRKSTAVEVSPRGFGAEYLSLTKKKKWTTGLCVAAGHVVGLPLIGATGLFLESSFIGTLSGVSLGAISLMGISLFGPIRSSNRVTELASSFYKSYGINRWSDFSSADFTPGKQLDEFSYEFPDGSRARVSVIASGLDEDPLVMISPEAPKQILNPAPRVKELTA